MAELGIVTPTDYYEAASFLASFKADIESQALWLDNFQFWWDNNPAFSNDLERGWLLRENGQITGFLGSIPTCFQLDGRSMTVFNSTTWRVLPEARHQSMNLLSRLLSAAKHSIVFNTTPNQEVTQILKALKFHLIPGLEEDRRSLAIINFEKVFLSKLGHDLPKKILAKASAPFLHLIQQFRLRNLGQTNSFQVKQITEADTSFDQLWSRTRDLYANTNLRTADIINWSCFQNKSLKKTVFGCYRNDQLYGYAVFETKFSNRYQLNLLECLDLWVDPTESKVVNTLVKATIDYAHTHAVDAVSFPHFNNPLDQSLSRLGLFQTRFERNEYLKASPQLARQLTPENSYFVGLQGDTGLA